MAFRVLGVHSRSHLFQDQSFNIHQEVAISKNNLTSINRKLLASLSGGENDGSNRITDAKCSEKDIYIFQSPTTPLPNGIPTYTVEIHNVCITDTCTISDIHLSCGWYSSARLINPNIFRRIAYNDCLVNNGNPTTPGQTISFQYANTFPYPMTLASYTCNCA
ncbi:hypothetical protein Ccrd_001150 [Cynara cardunculus var. scolymus]|uniref:Uncharacterized protein n=1 Tax=Cynara cardunculus var. scolymus TaxID=59895 RepID=A0A118JX98_CYNCS|nr:hypothetical protein Ccrd_001150 [Cynara cardunculus var. scolymus]